MPEHSRTDRPCHKGDSKGGKGLQRCRGRIPLREEDMGEHDHRGGGVDIEVEELNGSANE